MAIVEPPSSMQAATQRILVVDDEPTIREMLGYNLRRDGFVVEVAEDGREALAAARRNPPDLVVLDIMLPGMDGFQVCRALRQESNVPILVLSARGEEFDRVHGLELGADDYLTKPFAMRELLARVRSLLRRAQLPPTRSENGGGGLEGAPGGGPGGSGTIAAALIAGDLEVDVARRQANRAGTALTLKPKEFDLLHYLVRNPGIVLSRDALLREVWGYDYPIDTRTVDVHVRWLRQKVEDDPSAPRRIETVRGFGYRFVADPR
jgi:two-component system OmpR family response regulator